MTLKNDKSLKFLDTVEALQGKKEVENHTITKIGSLKDLDQWMDSLWFVSSVKAELFYFALFNN